MKDSKGKGLIMVLEDRLSRKSSKDDYSEEDGKKSPQERAEEAKKEAMNEEMQEAMEAFIEAVGDGDACEATEALEAFLCFRGSVY
jgi:hypothetical protein